MISHDATLVISALVEAGGEADVLVLEQQVSARLSCTFATAANFLLDKGFVEASKLSCASKLRAHDRRALKLKHPKKYKVKCSYEAQVSELLSLAVDRRNFHAAYQAVVAGKSVRADPVSKFAAQMNPHDRGEFWQSWSNMSEAEQAHYRTRIARLVNRSRRDCSTIAARRQTHTIKLVA